MTEEQVKVALHTIFDTITEIVLANFTVAERMGFTTMYEECRRYIHGDIEYDEAEMLKVRVEADRRSARVVAEEFIKDGDFMRVLSALVASSRQNAYRRMEQNDPAPNSVIFQDSLDGFVYNLGNMGYAELVPVSNQVIDNVKASLP